MTKLISDMLNNPIVLALLIFIAMYLLRLISDGKVRRIGRDGLELREQETTQKDDPRVDGLETRVNEVLEVVREQSQTIKDIELAVIRLQILSDQTNLETKLKLFDIYKSKGGNSYIDLYIKQLEQAATASAKED